MKHTHDSVLKTSSSGESQKSLKSLYRPLRRRNQNPRILLIDDDPVFCRKLKQHAKKAGIQLATCHSFEEYEEEGDWQFDIVMMDFDLGNINGVEFAKYLFDTIGTIPILLISNMDRELEDDSVVSDFLHKKTGVETLLDTALQLHARAKPSGRTPLQ